MNNSYTTRPASHIALTLVLSLSLAACQDQKEPTLPAIAPTVARAVGGGAPVTNETQLADLRAVTARFQNFEAAKDAHYDTQITPCWAHHSEGAMGYHYGNTGLFDANADLLNPEVVIYEPQAGGPFKLVGLEYVVPVDAWAAAHHNLNDPNDVPQLLGQNFTRHETLPIFKLHVWLWRDNPSGTFTDWNPRVSCQNAETTEIF